MDAYDNGRERLRELVLSNEGTDRNESTTRLHLVDVLIRECLNWPLTHIVAEHYRLGEFADYVLGKPSLQVIWEAKREGVYFELPVGINDRLPVALATLREDPSTDRAIRQVLAYCHARGVPIACVTNGTQVIAFYASRTDGIAPLDGRAVVYASLDSILTRWSEFWGFLSPGGLSARSLQTYLRGKSPRALALPRLADKIPGYPGRRRRTDREVDLRLLADVLLQDLESEPTLTDDFLINCYVSSGAGSPHLVVSREVLRANYSTVADVVPEISLEVANDRQGPNSSLTAEMVAAVSSIRPIVLLGEVGVGKSIFLHNLLQVEAKKVDPLAKAFSFYVDFGRGSALSRDLETYVRNRIETQLIDQYSIDIDSAEFTRAIYNGEINRFQRGLHGALKASDPAEYAKQEVRHLLALAEQRAEHLRRALEHLRATEGRLPVIVLDNVDQQDDGLQEAVFLIGTKLAAEWPGTVFVSLRPDTFARSKRQGTLAAYHPRVFTMPRTRADLVVDRRLTWARTRVAEGAVELPNFPNLSNREVVAYLDTLLFSLKQEPRLMEILENLGGGNLRQVLTYLTGFIGSGYVKVDRVLAAEYQYVIPVHEFVRAIALGDYEFYSPRDSDVTNVFDVLFDDRREHFLFPLIIGFVHALNERVPHSLSGYVTSAEIYDFAQGLGFAEEQVGFQLGRAVRERALRTTGEVLDTGPFQASTVGVFTTTRLASMFSYLDAILVNTPVLESSVLARLVNVDNILGRLDRCEVFLDYLGSAWALLPAAASTHYDWPRLAQVAREEVLAARSKVLRAKTTGARSPKPAPPRH